MDPLRGDGDGAADGVTPAAATGSSTAGTLPPGGVPAAAAAGGLDEPAALREDQIQNAVSFLSHAKVRGSAEAAKRSFLEKKGLKAAEIEEAFRRVPPEPLPPPPAAAHQPGAVTPSLGANNLVTYTQQQQHAAPPGPGAGSAAASPAHHQAMVPAAPLPLVQQQPIRWTQAVLGLGVAAASLYGLHQLLAPRLSGWSQALFASRRAAAQEEAARTAALTDALENLAAGQGRLQETLDALASTLQQQQQQQQTMGGCGDSQQTEYLAAQSPALSRHQPRSQQQQQQQQQQQYGNYGNYGNYGSGSSLYGGPPPAGAGISSTAGHASSGAALAGGGGWDPYGAQQQPYDDGHWAPPQHGGRPGSASSARLHGHAGPGAHPGVQFEVSPPAVSSNRAHQPPAKYQQQQQQQQPASGSSAAPAGDPGFARRAGMHAAGEGDGGAGAPGGGGGSIRQDGARHQDRQQAAADAGADDAPRSLEFHRVMMMVQNGITPPNVRGDINDAPPDPSRPLSAPHMQPRSKPWEGPAAAAAAAAAAPSAHGSSTPFTDAQQEPQQQAAGGRVMRESTGSSGRLVADGPGGFGVHAYGSAPPGSGGPPQQQQQHQQLPPATTEVHGMSVGSSSSVRVRASDAASVAKAPAYDLSALLGDEGRAAPWRPPPPPAATVARPASSGSNGSGKADAAANAAAAPAAAAAAAAEPVAHGDGAVHGNGAEEAGVAGARAAAPHAQEADAPQPAPAPAPAAAEAEAEAGAEAEAVGVEAS